jgi:hypothetical protein
MRGVSWYGRRIVRRSFFILVLLSLGILTGIAATATYKLNNGQEISGEVLPSSANDQGVQVKIGEGEYQRVPWANFPQDVLKIFAQDKKMEPFVEPFIEITRAEKLSQTQFELKPVPRLPRLPSQSLLGAIFSSGVGLLIVLLLYAANIYAGYEVAIFRAQPPAMVAGLSAIPVLGFLVPIIFLAMPTRFKPGDETTMAGAAEAVPAGEPGAAPSAAEDLNPMRMDEAAHPTSLRVSHSEHETGKPAKPAIPPSTTFQRGQFTFNRRFFETKFGNFFGVVRRDADKDMVLLIKSARGQYAGQRISRITSNDLHLDVHHGGASQEVMIPFQEIKEIVLKHKDAP